MEEPIDIFIDRKTSKTREYLVFKFRGGFEYDPDLRDTKQDWWLDHMRGKNWFTKEVENKTLEILKTI